jgi:Toxin PAAR-like domain/A nuclease of the HNH/ENDO VII superfamily with conserved WHH
MPKEGAPKTHDAKVVCLCPDVCLTPVGPSLQPVPYPIIGYFDDAVNAHNNVKFKGLPTFTIQSAIQGVKGDEAGTGGGVTSGSHAGIGYICAQSFSATVRIGKKNVVRDTDLMAMNGSSPNGPGNTVGRVVYCPCATIVRIDANGNIIGETDPPFQPNDLEIDNYLKRKWEQAKKAAEAAQQRLDPNPQNWNPLEQFKSMIREDVTAFMKENRVIERGLGLLGLVGAGFEGIGGVLAIAGGVATVNPLAVGGGGVLFTHSLDSAMASYIQMTSGEPTATVTQQVVTEKALEAGYSPEVANWMGVGVDGGISLFNPSEWEKGYRIPDSLPHYGPFEVPPTTPSPPHELPKVPSPHEPSMAPAPHEPPKALSPSEPPKSSLPQEAPRNQATAESAKDPSPGNSGSGGQRATDEVGGTKKSGESGNNSSESAEAKGSESSKEQSGSRDNKSKGKDKGGNRSGEGKGKDGAKVTRKRRAPSPRQPNAVEWIRDGGKVQYHPDGSTTFIAKDGTAVTYNPNGYPDFSPHADKSVEISPMTGKGTGDFTRANQAAGLPKTPPGYTWHHVQDGKTMQLIPTKIHDQFPHTGGASIARGLQGGH